MMHGGSADKKCLGLGSKSAGESQMTFVTSTFKPSYLNMNIPDFSKDPRATCRAQMAFVDAASHSSCRYRRRSLLTT